MQDPRNRARRTFAPAPVQTTEEIRRQAGDAGRSFVGFVARERDPRRMRIEEDGRDSIRAVPDRPVDRVLAMLPESVERAARSAGRAFDRGPIGTALRLVRESDPSELAADAAGGPLIRGARVVSAARALPMDEASRVARARELGFDPDRVFYHGTNASFSSFDPLKMGRTDEGWFGKGFYFSPDPQIASQYANTGAPNVIPVNLRVQNPYDWRKHEGVGMRLGTADESYAKTRDIISSGHDAVDVYQDIVKGNRLTDDQWNAYVQHALYTNEVPLQREFVEKAIQRGVAGEDFAKYFGEELKNQMPVERRLIERVVFNPSNIRSRFAAFDPAKRDSADLLASLALPAMFTGGTVANQRRKREDQ